ncbi:MAG TPA: hypothetical protein VFX55_13240 [Duganella sp.]|nr:hypothetical protein [Duganella sp.]
MKVIKLAALLALTWACAGIAQAGSNPAAPQLPAGAPTAPAASGADAANAETAPLPPPSSAAQHL